MNVILLSRSAMLTGELCKSTQVLRTGIYGILSRKYANIVPRFKLTAPDQSREIVRGKAGNGTRYAAGNIGDNLIGACTVMYQVGSRDEIFDDLGASHFVRVGTMNNGLVCTGFIKSRILQQEGLTLSVRTDRQTMAFTMTCPPPLFEDLKEFLVDTGVSTRFEDYNLTEIRAIVREDLSKRPPQQHALDLLQAASFSGALSNSIYCAEERVDTMTASKLRNFMKRCSPHKCTIGSWGLPWGHVAELADKLVTMKTAKSSRGCSFAHRSGYEFYDMGHGSPTFVGLSVPSEGTKDFGKFLKYSLLAATCSYGAIRANTLVMRYLKCALSVMNPLYSCQAVNIGYLDAGIFGFLLQTTAEDASCLTTKLLDFMTNIIPEIPKEEYELAKRRLKIMIARDLENCEDAATGLALAAAIDFDGGLQDIGECIDNISEQDLQQTATNISDKCKNGQVAIAVLGDVEAVPPLEEKGCSV